MINPLERGIIMKKKLLLLPLFALMALSACTNSDSSSGSGGDNPPVDPTPGQETKALDFMERGMVRLDIMTAGLGITFNYGNNPEIKTENIGGHFFAYNKDNKLTASGELATETINFVVVNEKTDGSTLCVVNPGILKEHFAEYFKDFTETNLASANKAYIAVSAGNEVLWNKNNSEKLNELIQSMILK